LGHFLVVRSSLALRLIVIEISFYEIYYKVIVPDIYQLEKGVLLQHNGTLVKVIGTIHIFDGDNKEIEVAATIHG
jgi:hypothetical protein